MRSIPVRWPTRKKLWHVPPGWVGLSPTFFVTICCAERGKNQLCNEVVGRKILDSIAFNHDRGAWYVSLAVLMTDHLHLLVSVPEDKRLGDVLRAWKSYIGKVTGVRWQRDFFDYRIRNNGDFNERTDYMLNNPIEAGLIAPTEQWPYRWNPSNANHR